MKLQKLLFKLSYNKDIRVECFYNNGMCTITLSDWWNSNHLLSEQVIIGDIPKEILEKFKHYI